VREVRGRGLDAMLREIDAIRRAPEAGVVTVVLPDEPLPLAAQVVLRPSLVRLKLALLGLHNHRAFRLKAALLRQPGIGVADVTFHLRHARRAP
jgi:hypothetical protein